MKKYFKNKTFLIGFIFFAFIFAVMIFGFFALPYDPNKVNVSQKLSGFSKAHLLGTDNFGRDVLSRIMVASRISILLGVVVMICGFLAGLVLGSVSGFYGGKIDLIIMKLLNTQMSFPGILLALMLVAVFDNNIKITFLALFLMSIPRFTRITRSGFIKYKNSLFVKAAKAKGASDFRIMYFHILPNILSEIFVTGTTSFSMAILSESGLSYLGLGIQPPNASFGRMLNDAQNYILTNPKGVIIPLIFLSVLVLGINLIGDGILEVKENE